MEQLSILIKPVSGNCNLACTYCFYRDEMKYREKMLEVMDDSTMQRIARCVCSEVTGNCTIGFQGGEPMLAGLDYYRRFVALIEKFNTNGTYVHYTIQTNGILIDDEWAAFFSAKGFLVGVSLDGTEEVHNLHRGAGSYQNVIAGITELKKAKAQFNIVSVVTGQFAKAVEAIYLEYKKRSFKYQQYIACLDPLNETPGTHSYSLTPAAYAEFLRRLFDLWYTDMRAGNYVYIRSFYNIVLSLLGDSTDCCTQQGRCAMQTIIEADGSVYPCDFYALDEYCVGNINDASLESLFIRGVKSSFVADSHNQENKCISCPYFRLCRGGCRRERQQVGNFTGENYFCSAYFEFYKHSWKRFVELAHWVAYCRASSSNNVLMRQPKNE